MDKAYLVREVKSFLMDEDGVGVIELVLILVVLIGLVIVFKKQINTLLTNIFKQINSKFQSRKRSRISGIRAATRKKITSDASKNYKKK